MLTENHGWFYATPSEVFSDPPLTPVDGIVTLDTRVAPNREADQVLAGLFLCGDEACATSGDAGTNARYMRIRLRADGVPSTPSYQGDDCSEGVIGFSNNAVNFLILYAPNVENYVELTGNPSFIYIHNNGSFADYVVPVFAGETGGLGFGVLDSHGLDGCSGAYFKLDIDYIDFIP